jgi:IS30 family transposase
LQILSHLTFEQRYPIEVMFNQGYKKIDIAKAIKRDKSVVSREISRYCDGRFGHYNHDLAQRKYDKRLKEKPKYVRFTPTVQQEIENLIKEDYSPEQIVGTLKINQKSTVSVERIYQHIWEDKKKRGILYVHLRNQGRHYRKRGAVKDTKGIIKERIDIAERPAIVVQRSRFGDLVIWKWN